MSRNVIAVRVAQHENQNRLADRGRQFCFTVARDGLRSTSFALGHHRGRLEGRQIYLRAARGREIYLRAPSYMYSGGSERGPLYFSFSIFTFVLMKSRKPNFFVA